LSGWGHWGHWCDWSWHDAWHDDGSWHDGSWADDSWDRPRGQLGSLLAEFLKAHN
jgi:hypothetical protein